MFLVHYEARTEQGDLYIGKSRLDMITAIFQFVNTSSVAHLITKEEINNLDEKALEKIGVHIYIADW